MIESRGQPSATHKKELSSELGFRLAKAKDRKGSGIPSGEHSLPRDRSGFAPHDVTERDQTHRTTLGADSAPSPRGDLRQEDESATVEQVAPIDKKGTISLPLPTSTRAAEEGREKNLSSARFDEGEATSPARPPSNMKDVMLELAAKAEAREE